MQKYKFVVILLISMTVLSLELIWTRIFSAEFFYTFAFLILSLAVAGLGLGALSNRLFKKISNAQISFFLLLTVLASLIGPPLVFLIDLEFSVFFGEPIEIVKVFFAIIILSSSFYFSGIAISKIFKLYRNDLAALYMFDMVGAGIGCAVSLLLMNLIGTPMAVAFVGLPLAVAIIIIGNKIYRILSGFLIVLMIIFSFFADTILEKPVEEKAPVIYTHWDSMAKLKIYQYNEYYRGLMTDNTSGSTIIGFDGNFNRPDNEKFDYGINISYLLNYTSPCTFLSLGAGGGMDVLQALFGGAEEVHAVEVNPHINYLMTDGELSSFSGNIYKNPKVKVITEDARAYIRRFENKFDIIFARNSNSYAALASGAFALAENYLFTTEAFSDYWKALSDKGFIVMDHQSYVPRMISSVLKALRENGIESAEKHIAVYESMEFHRKIILISKQELSKQLIFFAFDELKMRNTNRLRLLYPVFEDSPANLETKIIEQGWEMLANDASTDISPTEDDRPFIAQLGLWKNFKSASLEKVLPSDEFYGFPISQLLILIIILVTILIILPLNLLPYLKISKNKSLKFSDWIFFFLIGVAYMAIEVVLIQKYTLFLGPSVYGLITILSVMLISSGLGSKFSNYFSFKIVFMLIIAFVLIDVFVYTELIYIFGDLEIIPRVLITMLLIFPLGFFMGMPFPKGGSLVGENIDWAFAVNGSASVLGSCLILLISFNYGFKVALILSAIIYLLAFISIFFISKNTSK